MTQHLPQIELQDIDRIIERDYSLYKKKTVLKILNQYKGDNKQGQYRVWADILKISSGNLEQLTKNIEKAKFDYRDVLTAAEYPIYSDLVGGFETDEFTEEELNAITEKDWDQYQNWLKA